MAGALAMVAGSHAWWATTGLGGLRPCLVAGGRRPALVACGRAWWPTTGRGGRHPVLAYVVGGVARGGGREAVGIASQIWRGWETVEAEQLSGYGGLVGCDGADTRVKKVLW